MSNNAKTKFQNTMFTLDALLDTVVRKIKRRMHFKSNILLLFFTVLDLGTHLKGVGKRGHLSLITVDISRKIIHLRYGVCGVGQVGG